MDCPLSFISFAATRALTGSQRDCFHKSWSYLSHHLHGYLQCTSNAATVTHVLGMGQSSIISWVSIHSGTSIHTKLYRGDTRRFHGDSQNRYNIILTLHFHPEVYMTVYHMLSHRFQVPSRPFSVRAVPGRQYSSVDTVKLCVMYYI